MVPFKVTSLIAEIRNKWITLIGERILDESKNVIDYWRVERVDSVIVIPFVGEKIVTPKPYYRHGIGEITFDFPGGRIDGKDTPLSSAIMVLERELGVHSDAITDIKPINEKGWFVDSSFSSQKVYAFEAILSTNVCLTTESVTFKELTDKKDIPYVLEQLRCLQCRHALLEWYFKEGQRKTPA